VRPTFVSLNLIRVTTDERAEFGKTGRPVRREGRSENRKSYPYFYVTAMRFQLVPALNQGIGLDGRGKPTAIAIGASMIMALPKYGHSLPNLQ